MLTLSDRLFFPPVVETEEATTNGTGHTETEEKSEKEETPQRTRETDENTDTKETSTNGGEQHDSGDESWEEVEMEKSELELKLEAEAEEVAQKLPDPPTSDPAEVEEAKKKGE